MDRTQIILACVVFIVIWMLGKRFFQKSGTKDTADRPTSLSQDDVETWFSRAQERAAGMDEETKAARSAAWAGLSPEKQMELSENLIGVSFAPKLLEEYTVEEKLKIGRMSVIVGDRIIPPPKA